MCADGITINFAKGLWLFALKFGVTARRFLSRCVGRSCRCDSGAVLAVRARATRLFRPIHRYDSLRNLMCFIAAMNIRV